MAQFNDSFQSGNGNNGDVKTDVKVVVETDVKTEVKADAQSDLQVGAKDEVQADAKAEVQGDAKAEVQGDAKAEVQGDAKAEVKTGIGYVSNYQRPSVAMECDHLGEDNDGNIFVLKTYDWSGERVKVQVNLASANETESDRIERQRGFYRILHKSKSDSNSESKSKSASTGSHSHSYNLFKVNNPYEFSYTFGNKYGLNHPSAAKAGYIGVEGYSGVHGAGGILNGSPVVSCDTRDDLLDFSLSVSVSDSDKSVQSDVVMVNPSDLKALIPSWKSARIVRDSNLKVLNPREVNINAVIDKPNSVDSYDKLNQVGLKFMNVNTDNAKIAKSEADLTNFDANLLNTITYVRLAPNLNSVVDVVKVSNDSDVSKSDASNSDVSKSGVSKSSGLNAIHTNPSMSTVFPSEGEYRLGYDRDAKGLSYYQNSDIYQISYSHESIRSIDFDKGNPNEENNFDSGYYKDFFLGGDRMGKGGLDSSELYLSQLKKNILEGMLKYYLINGAKDALKNNLVNNYGVRGDNYHHYLYKLFASPTFPIRSIVNDMDLDKDIVNKDSDNKDLKSLDYKSVDSKSNISESNGAKSNDSKSNVSESLFNRVKNGYVHPFIRSVNLLTRRITMPTTLDLVNSVYVGPTYPGDGVTFDADGQKRDIFDESGKAKYGNNKVAYVVLDKDVKLVPSFDWRRYIWNLALFGYSQTYMPSRKYIYNPYKPENSTYAQNKFSNSQSVVKIVSDQSSLINLKIWGSQLVVLKLYLSPIHLTGSSGAIYRDYELGNSKCEWLFYRVTAAVQVKSALGETGHVFGLDYGNPLRVGFVNNSQNQVDKNQGDENLIGENQIGQDSINQGQNVTGNEMIARCLKTLMNPSYFIRCKYRMLGYAMFQLVDPNLLTSAKSADGGNSEDNKSVDNESVDDMKSGYKDLSDLYMSYLSPGEPNGVLPRVGAIYYGVNGTCYAWDNVVGEFYPLWMMPNLYSVLEHSFRKD